MSDLILCKSCIWFDDGVCWNNQRICVDNSEYQNTSDVIHNLEQSVNIIKVLRITPDKVDLIEIENTLQSFKDIVAGYIECVTLSPGKVEMIVNEEGLLLDLPNNPVASFITGQYIAGNVVIAGVEGEDMTDVPQEAITIVRHAAVRVGVPMYEAQTY